MKEINLEIPITINSISIEDKRVNVSQEDDIKIPFISGLKGKTWKHHPKLSIEHKKIISNTLMQNFIGSSVDSASMIVTIKYACKEFEQTGKSEIERVYLDTETRLQTSSLEFYSSVVDTFYYESSDASKKHFEKFYQTSLRNNVVRNLSVLRDQYYKSKGG